MDDVNRMMSGLGQDGGRQRALLPGCMGGSARLGVLAGLKPRGSWVEQIRVNGEVDLWRI